MIALAGPLDVEGFRALVGRRLGLQFEEAKLGFLADVLQRRLDASGRTCSAYLARLDSDAAHEELGALAQELTVPETYFFRNVDQFHALTETALPQCMGWRAAQKSLRLLSAGCASGEEAYTIAILIREVLADPSWRVSIDAVDLNGAMLAKAARARFTAWALRETPAEVRQRWFRSNGNEAVLDDAIRNAVKFTQRNLAEDDAVLWRPDAYDVVFCRNVMMYFTPPNARRLVARIARSLVPGGFLFLGHAETLRGLSRDFHLCHTHGTFYYQRKDDAELAGPRFAPDAGVEPAPVNARLEAIVEGDDSWVDAIRKASERIRTLTQDSEAHASNFAAPRPGWDIGQALDLLRLERFAEALELVRALPVESARDPDVLLLHAVLLAHSGQPAGAEEVCLRLLGIDELNAGARYVLALCRESAGDFRGAAEHDQAAAYLDPAFAMPRLHLGLLARRAGEHETARREMAEAMVLLQREDASRLLLFGGGFSREALLALCRAAPHAQGRRT